MDTFFKKKCNRRWTELRPDDVDFLITRRNVTDLTVFNKIVSDHRTVRGAVKINLKNERT